MFRILVDTCVWLDLARDPRQHPVIGVVEKMIKQGLISILVPTLVLDEFKQNRDRIAKDSTKSLSTHFKVVKEAIGKVGGDRRKMKSVLAHLDDADHKLPIVGGSAVAVLDRVETLLTSSNVMFPSDSTKLRAADRALNRKAPFHRERNSMADALIIETYNECASKIIQGTRNAFVTHNKNDFSDPTNFKLPHPDLKGMFSRIKSLYFINLVEALRRVDPSFVTETMFELSWEQEPRGLHEILKAEELLSNQVWYNRHMNRRYKVQAGHIKIVDRKSTDVTKYNPQEIIDDIWKGALKAATRVEKQYGKKNLGPFDDFEWGMINGKLSALRWVLGDEWDMLDT
jgi:PIN domain